VITVNLNNTADALHSFETVLFIATWHRSHFFRSSDDDRDPATAFWSPANQRSHPASRDHAPAAILLLRASNLSADFVNSSVERYFYVFTPNCTSAESEGRF